MNRQETIKDHQERLNRALQYINEHMDEPLSLQTLADVACFSPYHFHRIFAAYVGEPLSTFVRRIRLEKAAHYLCHSRQSVIDIALAAGYESHAAFTKAFTKHFGESPTDFRKQRTVYLLRQQQLVITIKRKEDIMSPEIRNREESTVVYVQRTGPYKKAAEEAWGALCAFAGPRGLLHGQAEFIGIGYDDPTVTPEDKLRYDACVTITQDVTPEG
ncbi:MAG: AraC family transcriptional regulator, partial [Verrucomicrobiae bacterium]|nr:AraC family transcriptional regulator [Verrucomicrobiae bacterium]